MTAPAAVSNLDVQILQENVAKALSIVSRAAATKSTLPIVHNIYVGTDRGRLMLWATDLELGIRCYQGAKVNSEGALTVSAAMFKQTVGELLKGTLDLRLDGSTLRGECAGRTFSLATMNAEDYPAWPSFDKGASLTMPAQVLAKALRHTAQFAARSSDRPVLHAVNCVFTGDEAIFAAADGMRLTEYRVPLVSEPMTFNLPRQSAIHIRDILENSHEEVELTLSETGRSVQLGLTDIEICSTLIEGQFPTYPVILRDHVENATVELKASDLAGPVRLAGIYARENQGAIRLRFGDGRLTAQADAAEVGSGTGEVHEVTATGDGRVAIDRDFLGEILSLFGDDQIVMSWNAENKPVLWRRKDDASFVHVSMPMFVNW